MTPPAQLGETTSSSERRLSRSMAKPKPAASPFDALVQARQKTAKHRDVGTSEQLNVQTAKELPSSKLAKSTDASYLKFTTYIRKTTHRAVKVKLVEKDRELSDLVEELLSDWL